MMARKSLLTMVLAAMVLGGTNAASAMNVQTFPNDVLGYFFTKVVGALPPVTENFITFDPEVPVDTAGETVDINPFKFVFPANSEIVIGRHTGGTLGSAGLLTEANDGTDAPFQILFSKPARAFSAEFGEIDEDLTVKLLGDDFMGEEHTIPAGTGFFGIIANGRAFTGLEFVTNIPNQIESFLMDNVTMQQAIPEPATAALGLMTLGTLAGATRRRRA